MKKTFVRSQSDITFLNLTSINVIDSKLLAKRTIRSYFIMKMLKKINLIPNK